MNEEENVECDEIQQKWQVQHLIFSNSEHVSLKPSQIDQSGYATNSLGPKGVGPDWLTSLIQIDHHCDKYVGYDTCTIVVTGNKLLVALVNLPVPTQVILAILHPCHNFWDLSSCIHRFQCPKQYYSCDGTERRVTSAQLFKLQSMNGNRMTARHYEKRLTVQWNKLHYHGDLGCGLHVKGLVVNILLYFKSYV